MPRIELSDEMMELPYIVAAVGCVTNPLNVELFEKLYDNMDSAELCEYHKLIRTMQFSNPTGYNNRMVDMAHN